MGNSINQKSVGFIHTTPTTIGLADKFMQTYLPDTQIIHKYDGSVKVDNFTSPIGVTPKKNLLRYAVFADELERAGCDAIVSCCSLMPRAVKYAKEVVSIPFIQLDAIVLDVVVENYSNIGIINTTEYVIPYIEEGLQASAAKLNKAIEMTFSNNNTALDLFNAGKYDEHNKIVLEDVKKLAEKGVECILMGQIPFALLDEALKNMNLGIPIHCAGEVAFRNIKEIIGNR